MQDGGVIPDTRFPWVDGMANEGRRVMTTRARCKRGHHIQHAFVHGGWSGSYTFQGCISRRCKVEEVDVLATVEEVVVHVSEKDLTHSMFPRATVGELGVSATRVFGDGRCTWQT